MTDVGLDDLIKKDRDERKLSVRGRGGQRGGKFAGRPNNRPISRQAYSDNRQFPHNGRRPINNRRPFQGGNRQQRDDDKGYVAKHKPISKGVPAPSRVAQKPERTDDRTLKVMGLHPDFTNDDLYKLFATEGAMEKCVIEQDNFGRSLTTAVVRYHNASSAVNAVNTLNQHKVMNSILTVQPYKFGKR